jgi:haloalkane dehalogenase
MAAPYRPPAELYPFESNWLDLEGNRLHYLDEGPRQAPLVLMVHGNPSWSFYYRNLVLALRDRYRCIVPDHIGCGLSDKPGDDAYEYRLERRVADLTALMEHIAPTQAVSLVVHDWGGMIGCAWAMRNQKAIACSVILNTAAFRMPERKSLPFALWLAGRTPLGTLLVRGGNAFARGAARVGFKRPVDKAVKQAYLGPYDSWANRIATLRFVQDIPLQESDPGYEILEATETALPALAERPAMLAWGMQDFVFDHTFLERWLDFLPNARVLRHPDCGHYVLEDAGPELVHSIVEFLDEHANG